MKDTLEAREVSILDSPGNLHDAFKPIDWCGYFLGKGEGGGINEAQWENRKIITFRKREEDRKRDTGPEEHPCHHISLELMSGTLCCHKSDEVLLALWVVSLVNHFTDHHTKAQNAQSSETLKCLHHYPTCQNSWVHYVLHAYMDAWNLPNRLWSHVLTNVTLGLGFPFRVISRVVHLQQTDLS